MTDLTKTEPTRPWEPRPGESRADYVRFLAWAFQPQAQRSAPLPGSLYQTALEHSWHQRAIALDGRLRKTESVEQATQAIAIDALQLVRSELEARAAQSLANPGHQRLADVVALLRLLGELGAFAGKGPADAEPDYSSLRPDELETLAAAGAILAQLKARRS